MGYSAAWLINQAGLATSGHTAMGTPYLTFGCLGARPLYRFPSAYPARMSVPRRRRERRSAAQSPFLHSSPAMAERLNPVCSVALWGITLPWSGKYRLYRTQGLCQFTLTLSPPSPPVYVVEDQRRDDLGPSTCLTACWTALCCCCLWDMLT